MSGDRPRVRRLGYVGLGVSDLASWERFATDVLGFQWGPSLPDNSRLVRMDEHAHRLTLVPGGTDDVAFVGWEVDDRDELDTLERHLLGHGVDVRRGSRTLAAARGVDAMLTVLDPDGVTLEIHARRATEHASPFVPSRPVDGFRTGDLGMGHVVFRVANLARAEAFYREMLGFRVSDYINFDLAPGVPTTAAFLHCNARHHSIALVTGPLPKQLLHFMVEVHTIDDVGLALDRAEASGSRIAARLGRHTNDRMLSFYVESPSGIEVEYGCAGLLIDDSNWSVTTHDRTEIWGHQRGVKEP